MKISTRGQYAVRLMAEIAKNIEPISINSIAKKQEISPKYMEQIVAKLVKAKLLESTRGQQGGYKIAKPANQISIKSILETTGDTSILTPCLNGKCNKCNSCYAIGVWETLGSLIDDYLSSVTLWDLLNKTYKPQ